MTDTSRRNQPCPCGSGKKFKACCLDKKERKTKVRWTFDAPPWPNHIRFYPDGRIGPYHNETLIAPTLASLATYYDRETKPKFLNRVPISSSIISNNLHDSLVTYSWLVAIDTNTRVIAGQRISVSGIVWGEIRRSESHGSVLLSRALAEYRGLSDQEELYGWKILFQSLQADPQFRDQSRIGVIVDAYADRLDVFNQRREPVIVDCFVPRNVELLYASSDAGGEYAPNIMIRECDKLASHLLKHIERFGKAERVDYLQKNRDGVLAVQWNIVGE